MIAIRFVGGNKTSAPSKFACRDGYGARVIVELGDMRIAREHRCGEGWSTQNSPTMILGIGSHPTASLVSIRWPSGQTNSTPAVPEGTLLVAYENPADSPSGQAFMRQPYRIPPTTPPIRTSKKPIFPVCALDTLAKQARLHVYTTFTTTSPSSTSQWPAVRRLAEQLKTEGVDIVAVPLDEADDDARLTAYAKQWNPTSRLVNVPPAKRPEAARAYATLLGPEAPVPSTVITDDSGYILGAQRGLPSISTLRRLLSTAP
jgi:hypothetical protein